MRHRAELDGLRTFALAGVILTHAYPHAVPGGWIGVDMFFVLSGYLITSLLLREIRQTGTVRLRNFYVRRACRLMPALFGLLAFVVLMEFGIKQHPRPFAMTALMISASYLMNWSIALDWGIAGVLGHTWSLAVEQQFYLVWPIIVFLVPDKYHLKVTIALALAVIAWKCHLTSAGASAGRVYCGFDAHSDTLLIGSCLAQLTVDTRQKDWLNRGSVIPVCILLIASVSMPFSTVMAMTSGVIIVGLCTCWLILASESPGILRWLLSHPLATFIGRISYGIYLWHYTLGVYGEEWAPDAPRLIPGLIAIPVAVASYYAIERPVIDLRDRRIVRRSTTQPKSEERHLLADGPATGRERGLRFNGDPA